MAQTTSAATERPQAVPGAPFEFPSHVRFSEVDHRGTITLPAIIDYFQDCSTFHSEVVGLGIERLHELERAWVLTHWHIVVDRYPALCEPIVVGTYATSFTGLVAHRNFYLRDADGNLCVRADSTWALMDLVRMRPRRPEAVDIDPYGTHEPLPMPAEDRRVRVPLELQTIESFPVRAGQIDMNEHVNNCEYVRMALEAVPPREVGRVRVDYKRAAMLGDTIHPHIAVEEDRAVVDLRDADGATFAAVELA